MVHRVIILGGGFGGVLAAKRLLKSAPRDTTIRLISETDTFTFSPRLTEVVSQSVRRDIVIKPLQAIFGGRVAFVKGKADKINFEDREVVVGDRAYIYDTLLIATGAKPNFFGIESVKKHCTPFKTFDDAEKLRRQLLHNFSDGQKTADPKKRKSLLSVAVVGAGPTGVELILNIKNLVDDIVERAPELKDEVRLVLLNSADTILPFIDERQRRDAEDRLEQQGIEVFCNKRVTKADEESLYMQDNTKIFAAAKIWAAGVQPVAIPTYPTMELIHGRLPVDKSLQVRGLKGVFAVGDCAIYDNEGEQLPPTAMVAFQMGEHVAKNIANRINKIPITPFEYDHKGYFLLLGHNNASAIVKNYHLKGYPAARMRDVVYRFRFKQMT